MNTDFQSATLQMRARRGREMFIGRSLPLIDDIITRVQRPDIRLLGGETIDDVKSAFASQIDEGVAN